MKAAIFLFLFYKYNWFDIVEYSQTLNCIDTPETHSNMCIVSILDGSDIRENEKEGTFHFARALDPLS